MQLAMYQMLTNFASNSSPQSIPPLRLRSLPDHPSPIINHPKPPSLKRLGGHHHSQKRQRLVKTNPTSSE